MLYLLESDTRNVKWNGIPLHEATSAIIKEQMNGDFTLTVRYPITDSEIYQLFREDMLIKAPAPVLGPQLFRIKKPVENDDHLEITAYHITDDVMQRSINPLSVNKQSCWQALSQLVQVAKSPINDFSFTSDITDRRTINTKEVETLYSVLMDGAHSIVGTWEGEMVRDNFAISVKRNRGEDRGVIISTHKNLKSYQRTKNSQNIVTRIHAKSTFKAEGSKEDTTIAITVDSPLIGAYPYINERSYTNNNIQTVEEFTKWSSAKVTDEHIDKATDAIKIEAYELDGQTVHMGDTVNLKSYKHNVDVYKKAIAYEYDCLANNGQGAYLTITFDDKVKSGGNGGGVSAVANAILDKQETQFDIMLERALANADRAFDAEFAKREKAITDGIELAKAKAEEVKRELSDTINQRFDSFDNGPLQEIKRKAIEALQNAGASSLLAQEAKRIGLDSIARLEEFKRQTTSAQTALSGDLDILKRTIASDILPKQEQVTVEIAKQVEALVQTKKELAGVKSAQSTYEETTTRRLSELTNLANGKASKSELTQTAEELTSKIASLQVGGRNLYVLSKNKDISRSSHLTDLKFDISSGEISFRATGLDPYFGEATIHPKSVSDRNGVRIPVILGKAIYVTVSNPIFIKNYISYFDKNGNTVRSYKYYKSSSFVISSKELEGANFITIRFGCGGSDFEVGSVIKTKIKVEYGTIPTDWSPAPEDIEGQISIVESNFRQRADALDAGVNRLTEGLRTKADISALNVTAENIRQSVKSLETSTQNKLDQKLSQAEFEVRAGSIRQEILNATKDKADKTLVVAEAGKLREEFSNLRVGGTNLLKGSKGPFLPDRKPANFDNNVLYAEQTSIYMEQGQEYIVSAKTDGTFTAHHDGNKESDNVVLWIMDKDVRNYQIVSDLKTGTTGTKIIWNKPTGIYHLRVNTYHKEATKSVWDVKIEKGNVATDWSPAPEDTDGLITEAKATFDRTAQGLRTDLSAIQEYVNKDGQRQDALQRYAREESAKQVTTIRELVARDYVGKATYQEDVKGINQRIEAVKTSANKEIASQIASYRQSVDGKFTDISSQITTYKQDVGGQISGLSNRLTSSEQGTTTQISNLSNRINSNKQGTDNQISNLKTQVATNKANADSQFANVSNQLARKVETTDFQRVKETSQLYERILGNSENGIADKVARMAMTNQLFQVEVGKAFAEHQNLFLTSTLTKGFLGNNGIISVANATQKEVTSDFISVAPNEKIIFQHWVTLPENGMAWTAWQFFDKNKNPIDNRKPGLNAYKTTVGKQHNINQITVPANAYFVRFSARMYDDGLIKVEHGSVPSDYSVAPTDALEAVKTVQSQLDGSWSVQNLTSAGSIVSQINATNNQILVEAEKIRFKGKTLADQLTAIDGYFKRLFVGEGNFATLNTEVLKSNSITADKLVMDMAMARRFVSSDIFTNTLASKTAFINQLQSVIVSSTLLEGYKGWIGGFQIGTHDSGSGRWITGRNHFSVGMGNGEGSDNASALWVNWGGNWSEPGYYAWFVKNNGKMYCKNTAEFWRTPIVHGDLKVTGNIIYEGGAWVYSPWYNKLTKEYSQGEDWLYLYLQGGGRDWIHMNKVISDRRYKSNIQDSQVSGLDVIEKLKTYSYRKEYDGKIEDISCGIMAQDVQKYAPEAFFENPDGAYSYRTFELVPYLIKAIQELNQKIEKMEKTIA